jgi:putative methanogenesis marker protein 8
MTDEHVIEIAGARIRITDGSMETLSDPRVRTCPLRQRLYGHGEESKETVLGSLSKNMGEMGMYTADRRLELEERTVTFGASEIIADALNDDLLDCAVTVCDGAGTVIVTRAEVMQAIGAHMTGVISTSPFESVQRSLEDRGCVIVDRGARVDQIEGYRRALELGHRRIAVTVSGLDAQACRMIRELPGEGTIFVCHNTGLGVEDAEIVRDHADIVYACASRNVRRIVGPSALVQIGKAIPVFGLTSEGKRLILNRAMNIDTQLLISRSGLPSLDGSRGPEPLS